ncbi:MAG: hypothetical protein ACKO7P_01440 [Bacteroidota bacterium]
MKLYYLLNIIIGLLYLVLTVKFLLFHVRSIINPLNTIMKIYAVCCIYSFVVPLLNLFEQGLKITNSFDVEIVQDELITSYHLLVSSILIFIFSFLLFRITEFTVKSMFNINYNLLIIQNDYLFVSLHAIIFYIASKMTSKILIVWMINLFPLS